MKYGNQLKVMKVYMKLAIMEELKLQLEEKTVIEVMEL